MALRGQRADGSGMRSARALAALVALSLLLVAAAQAALAESPKTSFNAADQAAARAAVLKASDLGAGWTGSVKKGTVEGPAQCAGWNPRQADLVVTGAADSQLTTQGVAVFSSSWVYKSTRMIELDWQRTVVNMPMRCLAAQLGNDELTVVSTKRLSFPKLATYSARFRIVADVQGNATGRIFVDAVFVGRGRTAVSIGLVAPYAQRADADAAEIRLAKIVLSRIKT